MQTHDREHFHRVPPREWPKFARQNSVIIQSLRTYQKELELQNEELRQVQAKLRETSKLFRDLYDFAPSGYFTITPEGRIQDVNLKASAYFGRSRQSLLGSSFLDYIVAPDLPIFERHVHEVRHSKQTLSCHLKIENDLGYIFDVALESAAWQNEDKDKDENKLLIRSSLRDISEEKTVELELKAARDRAEASNSAKSQFLSNMSHEMRTPLGVIIGFTSLWRDKGNKQDLQKGLETIHRNGSHLLNLIDDLLDLAKIEAGQMSMETLPFHLEGELRHIIHQFSAQAEEQGVKLSLDLLTPLPATINTDPLRFRQVILNVLSNAMKFTSVGSIRLEVSLLQPEFPLLCDPMLQIDIVDSGCGIQSQHEDHLFYPFFQADATMSRRFGGTGLGLSLSRRLAEALGGSLSLLESKPGLGSIFRTRINPRLPRRPRPRSEAPEPFTSAEKSE